MEFVVEDPQRADGVTTYQPSNYAYDEVTEMWALRLDSGDGDVERRIPRERIVYIEGEPDASDGGLSGR